MFSRISTSLARRVPSSSLSPAQQQSRQVASAVFIKGLQSDVPIETLKAVLDQYGDVKAVHLLGREQAERRAALVHFSNPSGAISCFEDLHRSVSCKFIVILFTKLISFIIIIYIFSFLCFILLTSL